MKCTKTNTITRSRTIGGLKRFDDMKCVSSCPRAQMGSGFFSGVKHLHPSSLTFPASFRLHSMSRAGNRFKLLACTFSYNPYVKRFCPLPIPEEPVAPCMQPRRLEYPAIKTMTWSGSRTCLLSVISSSIEMVNHTLLYRPQFVAWSEMPRS